MASKTRQAPEPRPATVGLSVAPDGRDALRLLAYRLTGDLGRRITLTDALLAAVTVANTHAEETAQALPQGGS